MEVPEKIFLEKEKGTDIIHHLWGRTPVVSSFYEHIEYIRADVFIDKAATWFANRYQTNGSYLCANDIEDFVKYMKGE